MMRKMAVMTLIICLVQNGCMKLCQVESSTLLQWPEDLRSAMFQLSSSDSKELVLYVVSAVYLMSWHYLHLK